ncbi:MAG: hypothetical protein IJR65_04090 [Oscillospiraceae bacterium]|nr:hypothetical protein [Oscillospiraceae bacterium]
MSRKRQGYVLALVMVTMLLLSSVASLVVVSVTRNIQSGENLSPPDRKTVLAESIIERYYTHLKASKGPLDPELSMSGFIGELESFRAQYLSNYPGFFSPAEYDLTVAHDPASVPDGTPLNPGDNAFTVTLTVENDGIQLAAKSVQLLVTVSEVTEETPEGPVTSREVTLRSVEYLDDPAA